jgi:hypothetical protein
MPGINVSALSGGDLRRLLKVAHARRDGLLADRLEWEIAARATSGARPPAAFADHLDDDDDEPVEPIVAPDAGSFASEPAAEYAVRARPQSPRGVLLVTLGAVAGSLVSAALFWSLERFDAREGRADPATAMATAPEAPADRAIALLTPDPLPPLPQARPVKVETALPLAAPPAEAARKPVKRRVSASRPQTLRVAATEHPPRPPNLAEWLAGAGPDEPIH